MSYDNLPNGLCPKVERGSHIDLIFMRQTMESRVSSLYISGGRREVFTDLRSEENTWFKPRHNHHLIYALLVSNGEPLIIPFAVEDRKLLINKQRNQLHDGLETFYDTCDKHPNKCKGQTHVPEFIFNAVLSSTAPLSAVHSSKTTPTSLFSVGCEIEISCLSNVIRELPSNSR